IAALRCDRSGAAAIEFALIMPAFIALLVAILQTALTYMAQEGLETAAEAGARLLLTGQAQSFQSTSVSNPGMTGAQFQQAICGTLTYTPSGSSSAVAFGNGSLLPPFLSCSQLTAVVTTAGSFGSTSASSFSTTANTAPTFTFDTTGTLTNNGSGTANGTVYGTGVTSTVGGQGNIIVVQLVYLWPTLTSLLGFNISSNIANDPNSYRELVATQVIVTENYSCPTNSSGTTLIC
ncbi:MAG: TadE/TadG family type IV pilus assembly protein, partial [Rhodoferax sp.]|nr:TadE/TadG family type IV pilus assembly protein [Rhodoferax sp.]